MIAATIKSRPIGGIKKGAKFVGLEILDDARSRSLERYGEQTLAELEVSEREAAALVEYLEGVKHLEAKRALPRQPLPREQSVAGLMKRLMNG